MEGRWLVVGSPNRAGDTGSNPAASQNTPEGVRVFCCKFSQKKQHDFTSFKEEATDNGLGGTLWTSKLNNSLKEWFVNVQDFANKTTK